MNLFRSEEHIRRWSGFKNGTDEGILSLDSILEMFSTDFHVKKMSRNYVSCIKEYNLSFFEKVSEIKEKSFHWSID